MSLRDLRARGGRASGKDADTAATTRPAAGGSETLLPAGCELVGQLRFPGSVRIEGRVEGEVQAAQRVVVGEGARIEADLRAEEIEIHGTVRGDIVARRNTVLSQCARVEGEIQTVGIVVAEGARFKGCIVIGSDEAAGETATAVGAAESEVGTAAPSPASKKSAADEGAAAA